jgi:uncharacterized protein YbcI
MKNLTRKRIAEMNEYAKKFVTEQLAENSTFMRINFGNELLVVHISNSLWPAEQRLNRRIEDISTFHEFKSRQFEEVKNILKSDLENLSECKIHNVESILCKDNSRIIVVTFLKSVENELKNKEFANEQK